MKNLFRSNFAILFALIFLSLAWGCGDKGALPKDQKMTACSPCDDSQRYQKEDKKPGTIGINQDQAENFIAKFEQVSNSSGQRRKGVFISKRALDLLFCNNQAANGVEFFFALGPDDSLNVVLAPSLSDYSALDLTDGNELFRSASFCPTDCGGSVIAPRDTTP